MRIACPSCNAAYQVPDEQLVVGRVVRCARCGTDWTPSVEIPADDPAAPPVAAASTATEPEPEPVAAPRKMALDDEAPPVPILVAPPPPAPPAPKRRRRLPLLAIAWVVSVAIVAGAVSALVLQRDRVMTAWPPSIRGYAAVGLAPKH